MERKEVPTVNLSTEILIKECSKKVLPDEDIFMDLRLQNRENVHDVFRYKKFNYDFIDKVTLYNDGTKAIGNIRPSYTDFILSLMKFLNIPQKKYSEEQLSELFAERINVLKSITDVYELMYEFPLLYEDLKQGRSFIKEVENMPKETDEEKKRYETQRHYYYSCALKRGLKNFIETQSEMYTRYTTKRREYKDLIESKDFNNYFNKNFDKDRVAMYTVHVYLRICERTDDLETIQKYLKLVNNYLNSSFDKSISMNINNEEIDIYKIRERIINIKKKFDIKDILLGWELIRPGEKDYSRVSKDKEHSPRITIFNQEEYERLCKAGERKNKFYEKTNYIAKAIGLEKYRGYIAYIYPNGQVLLDTEFDEYRPNSAIGDAIYHIKAIDFERLSRLDKTELKSEPSVKRIIHSKHWEDKARLVIDYQGTEQEKEESFQLVKRLKENKRNS